MQYNAIWFVIFNGLYLSFLLTFSLISLQTLTENCSCLETSASKCWLHQVVSHFAGIATEICTVVRTECISRSCGSSRYLKFGRSRGTKLWHSFERSFVRRIILSSRPSYKCILIIYYYIIFIFIYYIYIYYVITITPRQYKYALLHI